MTKMQLNKILSYIINAGLFLILLTPLIVSTGLFFPFITGKGFFFRIIVELIFAVWLWLAWRDKSYRPNRTWIFWSLVSLVVVAALATIFGQDPYHSFWSNFERMDGLISYLHLLAYFLVISSSFKTEKIWHWFFNASLAVSLIVAGSALAQLVGITTASQGKIDATLGNSTYLAVYALFHFFIALWFLARSWKRVWSRYLYIPLALLEVFVIYKTTTRGTLLGLVAGLSLAALILVIKKWRNVKIRRGALSGLAILVILIAGFWFARQSDFVKNSPTLSRFANISLDDSTTEARLTIWQMSLRGFREHPVLGWGPENYNLVFNKYYQPKLYRDEQWFDRSHDIFLDWLVTTGALGLAAYLALFVAAFYYLWRSKNNSHSDLEKSLFTGLLAAYLVNNIFVFDNLISYILFFSLLAYFAGEFRAPVSNHPDNFKLKTDGVIALVLFSALSFSLYYFNFKPMIAGGTLIDGIGNFSSTLNPDQIAQERIKRFKTVFVANTFLNREASEQLVNQAIQATRAEGVSPNTKQTIATLALEALKQEVTRAPGDARTHLLLGSLDDAFGQSADAVSELTKANALSPNKQTIMFQLAAANLNAKKLPEALEIAARAFHLDERFGEARQFYALVLIYNKQIDKAEQVLAGDPTVQPDDRFINAYVAAERYDLVLKLWQDKVKANPNDTQSRFSLAAAYLQNGQRAPAVAELLTAATLNPAVKAQVDALVNDIRLGKDPLAPLAP